MSERIASFWCRVAHTKAMWPMHGKYICPRCLREYPVVWGEVEAPAPVAAGKPAREYRVSTAVTVAH
ncbi:MAG: hypothetical protein ACLQVN_06450 [Bryobacteraceae bacterium]